MAKPLATAVISHWYNLIENLQASPKEFYASVVQALKHREVPDANQSYVYYREAGVFSAMREYLRISRGKHIFDICGAPFGNGFFISWWLGEPRPSPLLSTLVALIAAGALWFLMRYMFGLIESFVVTFILLALAFFLIGALLSQAGEGKWVPYVLVVPLIGPLLERLFLPPTYYRIDTALMFQQTVHAAVLEVIDGMTKAKGMRALSELERKPIMRDFYRR